jgi:hypothetical protein
LLDAVVISSVEASISSAEAEFSSATADMLSVVDAIGSFLSSLVIIFSISFIIT